MKMQAAQLGNQNNLPEPPERTYLDRLVVESLTAKRPKSQKDLYYDIMDRLSPMGLSLESPDAFYKELDSMVKKGFVRLVVSPEHDADVPADWIDLIQATEDMQRVTIRGKSYVPSIESEGITF